MNPLLCVLSVHTYYVLPTYIHRVFHTYRVHLLMIGHDMYLFSIDDRKKTTLKLETFHLPFSLRLSASAKSVSVLWPKVEKILAIRQKKWNSSLIISVDLSNLIISDKMFLDIQLIHTFMPDVINNPWMVSTIYAPAWYCP